MINPALISAGVSLLGMAANAKAVKDNNATNIQLMRERNAAQSAANAAAFQREVAYNNPSAQVGRMKAAGLNPNLLYESAPMNTVNMVAPDIQAAQAQAVQYDTAGVTSSLLAAPGIDSTRAQTAKTIAETNSIDLDNQLKSATLGDNIKMANLNVKVQEKGLEYTTAQIAAFSKNMSEIDEKIAMMKEQTQSIKQSRYVEMVNLSLHTKEVRSMIDNLASQSSLSKAQIVSLITKLPYEVDNLVMQGDGYYWDAKSKKLQFQLDEEYEEEMKKLGWFRGVVDVVGTVLGGLLGSAGRVKVRR